MPPRKIVVFKQWYGSEKAQDKLLKDSGALKIKPLKMINGMAAHISTQTERALEKRNEVLRIDADLVIQAFGTQKGKKGKDPPGQPFQEFPWNMFMVGANLAWMESKGTAVRVAILDTGVDLDHSDLYDNIRADVNIIKSHKTGDDDSGHGTHVAGIVAAVDNSIGVIGIGPEIDLYAVKVLNKHGRGWLSDLIDGLDWCLDNGIQVINMSLGSLEDSLSFHEAIQRVHEAGIVQVAAAGNRGEEGGAVSFPAAYPETISVSAVDQFGNFASFSSYGLDVDLTAPGVNIQSSYNDGLYMTLSGTSMSAPHVTGTAALILTTFPSLPFDVNNNGTWDPSEIKTVLKLTAENLGLPIQQQGAGLVRADEAIR